MRRILLALWKFLTRHAGLHRLLLHAVNARFIVSASAVIVDDDGRVLLFHHTYRNCNSWGIPGGWLKRGENAVSALCREVAEESGLAVDVLAPLFIDSSPKMATMEIMYLARLIGGDFMPSDEVDECRWFDLAEKLPEDMKDEQKRVIAKARRAILEGGRPHRKP
jgi:8-oxo-dGTP diphosphatase